MSFLNRCKSAFGRAAQVTVTAAVGAGVMGIVAAPTYAVGLADLAGAIDTVDILAGFTAVALLIGAVLAARMGIRKVLGMIK
jgi:hypothetical protein